MDQLKVSETLNRENFRTWLKQVECLFIAISIDDLMDKEYKDDQAFTKDKVKHGKGLFYIRSFISQTDQLLILNCTTIKQAIDMLKNSYQKSTRHVLFFR